MTLTLLLFVLGFLDDSLHRQGSVKHFALSSKKDPLLVLTELKGLMYYNANKGKTNHGLDAPLLAKGFLLLEQLPFWSSEDKFKPTVEGPLVAPLLDAE